MRWKSKAIGTAIFLTAIIGLVASSAGCTLRARTPSIRPSYRNQLLYTDVL